MANPHVTNNHAVWEVRLRVAPQEAIPDELAGRWWVAHTKPRNEKALARDLEALSVFWYLPACQRLTRSRNTGRISRSIVPAFPSYLFFNATEDQRIAAQRTNRVANLLEVFDQRELVGQLRQIQSVLASGADFEHHAALDVGDWARVTGGPLAGLEGVVCRRARGLRLMLNVRMLAQSISVEVPRDVLEKIDRPSYLEPDAPGARSGRRSLLT